MLMNKYSKVWSLLDSIFYSDKNQNYFQVITAVSNFTLKIWKSCDGQLLTTLCGHKDEIYVLEPHPISVNILLTGAHDGQVWPFQ